MAFGEEHTGTGGFSLREIMQPVRRNTRTPDYERNGPPCMGAARDRRDVIGRNQDAEVAAFSRGSKTGPHYTLIKVLNRPNL